MLIWMHAYMQTVNIFHGSVALLLNSMTHSSPGNEGAPTKILHICNIIVSFCCHFLWGREKKPTVVYVSNRPM